MSADQIPAMEPVQSSNVLEVGHDGSHLVVRFRNGGLWRYHDVHPANYAEMKGCGSVGKYLAEHIKPNHRAEKIG